MGIPLTTKIIVNRSAFDLTCQTPTMTIGSCFSDHVGGILSKYKFNILKNPFGVLYNPQSIAQAIKLAIKHQTIAPDDLIAHQNSWHSFYFHSTFSDNNSNKVIEKTNAAIDQTNRFLKSANYLFITFGTAWAYRHNSTGIIVSNCHKIPSTEFDRFRLTVDEIADEWNDLITELKKFNPNLKIIFTISPIRHLKDGAHENQLSKSVLFLAIDKLMHRNEQIDYFPSYEIVHDELRDYRFYANDMVHISDTAVMYLFEKFESAYFSPSTIEYLNDIKPIITAKEHRLLSNNLIEIKKFAQTMIKKIDAFEIKYPYVKLLLEKNHFENL